MNAVGRYTVREQATRRLWLAGADAESALREALKSRDPEVARRARELLDKIEWGIFADTPDEVVTLVEKYRAGDATAQSEAVRGLVNARRPGLTVLARIGHRVAAEARPALAKAMTDAAREVVPQLLAAHDYAAAGELLETCVASGVDAALTDYAAFVILQGQLDAGPPGMTVTPDGKIEWTVPGDFADGTATVIISVSDASGQEVFKTFKITLGG